MNLYGVLHNETLLTPTMGPVPVPPMFLQFTTLGNILDLAEKYQVRQLWISKGSGLWQGLKHGLDNDLYHAKEFFKRPGRWTIGKGGIKNTISAWIDGDRGSTKNIILPGLFGDDWALDEIEDPFQLANALESFKDNVRVMPSFPFKVARELVKQTFPAEPKDLPAFHNTTPAKFWEPWLRDTEHDLIWLRPLTRDEKKMPFVHAFDKRMMFLSAARNATFGLSDYEEVSAITAYDLDKNAAGVCEIYDPSWNVVITPELGPFFKAVFDGRKIWPVELIRFIADQKHLNQSVKIKRAWLSRKPGRLFENFAKTLGDAIKATRSEIPSEKAVNASLKKVYTLFFGWLGRNCDCPECSGATGAEWSDCRRSGYSGGLFRPDWRVQIIAAANANLLRNAIEVYQFTRRLPFGIYHDLLLYAGENENAAFDFRQTCLVDDNRFTHEYTLTMKAVTKTIKDGGGLIEIERIGKEAAANG